MDSMIINPFENCQEVDCAVCTDFSCPFNQNECLKEIKEEKDLRTDAEKRYDAIKKHF